MTRSDHLQMSPGKMLRQDRPVLVRNVLSLSTRGIFEISVLEGAVPIYIHVTAEIRKLGWKQIKKGP